MKVYVAIGKRLRMNTTYVAMLPSKGKEVLATKDQKVIDEVVSKKGLERVSLLICDSLTMHSRAFNEAIYDELKKAGH